MGEPVQLTGPDLGQGASIEDLPDGGSLLGHAGGEAVLLVRRGDTVHAVGATCTHYSGPLSEGLVVGDTIRCPWHHACFDLRTGAPSAPAFNPIPCYRVERNRDQVIVREKLVMPSKGPVVTPGHVVIVGAGAAGGMAAETLRREGYAGRITLLGAEATVPVDRPNLSKDYLAGNAPEEWMPLRPQEFFTEQKIDLKLGAKVQAIDPAARTLTLSGGETIAWDALLLATGGEPIRLPIAGADLPHVHTLRTLADSRAIIGVVKEGGQAVVIGASFIGLEAAASLRKRGMEVSVVGKETLPLERVMGRELGTFIQKLHQDQGVKFHLGTGPTSIGKEGVKLENGTTLPADLVVMGVGVRPRLDLAEQSGVNVDRGVLVDEQLRTSAKGIWAAGDIARFPLNGEAVRIEHWAVAQRQGEVAAKNILGQNVAYRAVPFFWSMHYDVQINYVGHAERFDRVIVDGDVEKRDCSVSYYLGDKRLAVATLGRDLESLRAELELETNH
jgi:NADPH-dependent 2,4-dienoyl-CoA reductase/sulfur reductase-like enzyme/nitrite reductase/ring-hydroxylating ferredoxin subunit